jgi:NAD+ synthase
LSSPKISSFISNWLNDYCEKSKLTGFIVGISGGVDSALTSILCANTGRETILLNLPIRQNEEEYIRAKDHIEFMKSNYSNTRSYDISLTATFKHLEGDLPSDVVQNDLAMANTRSRLRMTMLYAIGQANNCLVVGTGNKVEDFGVGFFTKYGDGGVDLSPIADLTKSQVWELSREVGVIDSIIEAKPTDGLWTDNRSDEDHIGASYPELEWAMEFRGDNQTLTDRQKEVLEIFTRYHNANKHKMEPIPVCTIPIDLL